MSATTKSGNLDAKREEFRKYLEKEGVLEYLTKSLVSLYEEADKPTSALDYLKSSFTGKDAEVLKQKVDNLTNENRHLQARVKELEVERLALKEKVANLEAEKAERLSSVATQPLAPGSKATDNRAASGTVDDGESSADHGAATAGTAEALAAPGSAPVPASATASEGLGVNNGENDEGDVAMDTSTVNDPPEQSGESCDASAKACPEPAEEGDNKKPEDIMRPAVVDE